MEHDARRPITRRYGRKPTLGSPHVAITIRGDDRWADRTHFNQHRPARITAHDQPPTKLIAGMTRGSHQTVQHCLRQETCPAARQPGRCDLRIAMNQPDTHNNPDKTDRSENQWPQQPRPQWHAAREDPRRKGHLRSGDEKCDRFEMPWPTRPRGIDLPGDLVAHFPSRVPIDLPAALGTSPAGQAGKVVIAFQATQTRVCLRRNGGLSQSCQWSPPLGLGP